MTSLDDLAILEPHADPAGQRPEDAHEEAPLDEVLTKQVMRLLVAPLDEGRDGAGDLMGGC